MISPDVSALILSKLRVDLPNWPPVHETVRNSGRLRACGLRRGHSIHSDKASMAEDGEKSGQRAYAKALPGVDRSKAARIYIDGYYKNLLEQTEQRQKRSALLAIL